ncbi:hypothetical protein QFC20_004671 [Naganishia adeliensis]|uniref:Uncharacterized protein n=1 Tax=Naganishia adeliensis TaxID=92952 RepID=A0ACC2VX94_9TREE|nr:hypothetical protein QFC20_004671 [Naganishia adeliensis]
MPKTGFFKAIGEPYKSIRYDELCVTGDHVNVRWNAEDCEFTISGTYGLERVEAAKEARSGGSDE